MTMMMIGVVAAVVVVVVMCKREVMNKGTSGRPRDSIQRTNTLMMRWPCHKNTTTAQAHTARGHRAQFSEVVVGRYNNSTY
ncbi:hypothetical protein F5B17DRAFT_371620 [Nemania serpens]|nr:hypothetical protein F5B17DRAFT_371620 [Nemania serpens]